MAVEQLALEYKYGQFNRDHGRQEPSGEDTTLMIDCNTSSSDGPRATTASITAQMKQCWSRPEQYVWTRQNASDRTTNLKQNDSSEQDYPSRTYNNPVERRFSFYLFFVCMCFS